MVHHLVVSLLHFYLVHLGDDDFGDVVVDDVAVAIFVELVLQLAVATTDIEDKLLSAHTHFSNDDILEGLVVFEPVESLPLRELVPLIPVLNASVLMSFLLFLAFFLPLLFFIH